MIDIGVNLFNSQFDADRLQILANAYDAGISDILLTGTDLKTSEQAVGYCQQMRTNQLANVPKCHATVGLHPHDAHQWNSTYKSQLLELSRCPEVVAFGEMGLDYFRNFTDQAIQRRCFQEQAELAAHRALPLFIHDRDASSDTLDILCQQLVTPGVGNDLSNVVIHCFTGTEGALRAYLEAGCYIGITGWVCDNTRGQSLREMVPIIPLDRLLIETDAPFLRPHNAPTGRGPNRRRNTPDLLRYVVATLAELYGAKSEQIVQHSTHNARQLFNLTA